MSEYSPAVRMEGEVLPALKNINTSLDVVNQSFERVRQASSRAFDVAVFQTIRAENINIAYVTQQVLQNMKDVGAEVKKTSEEAKKASPWFENLSKKLSGIKDAGIKNIKTRIKTAGKAALEYASSLEGVQNRVEAIFGQQGGVAVDGWSQKMQGAFGLNELSAQKYAADLGAAVTQSGIDGDTALKMSQNMTQLASDMGARFHVAPKDITENMISALGGKSEKLNGYGVNLSDRSMGEFAAGKGIEKPFKDMSEGEKMLLRYQSLMEQTSAVQGSFAESQGSYAVQSSILNENLAGIAGTLAAGFAPVLAYVLSVINGVLAKVQDMLPGIQEFLSPILEGLTDLGQTLRDNWSSIFPVLLVAAAALAAYLLITETLAAKQKILNGIQDAWKGIVKGATAVQTFFSIGMGMLKSSTDAAARAQKVYNKTLLTSPITWIVLLIAGLIAILYLAVAAWNYFTGQSVSATGILWGALTGFATYLLNLVKHFFNIAAIIANFITNFLKDPIASVKILFLDMVSTVIGYALKMLEAIETIINKIPFVEVSITGGLSEFQDKINQISANIKTESEWTETVKQLEYDSIVEGARKGYADGENFADKVTDKVKGLGDFGNPEGLAYDNDLLNGKDWQDLLNGVTPAAGDTPSGLETGVAATAANTGRMADSMDSTQEDLEYLRDIAEQEAINRFTTSEIKVDMRNDNYINSKMDIDGIVSYLEDRVYESLEIMAEGVM